MWRFSLLLMLALASCVKSEYFELCSGVPDDTYIPVENECHSYIYCSDNADESFKDECPEGTYFEANSLECSIDDRNICPRDDADKVEAAVEIEETQIGDISTSAEEIDVTFATTTITPISTTAKEFVVSVGTTTPRPVCDRNVDTFYPHHARCEYYYKCVAGFLTILRCNFYYAWDYRQQLCVPQKEVQCYGNSKPRRLMQ